MLYLGKSKMSKSDGNFLAMGALLADFPAAVLRFFLLNCHFRSQLDFSEERLREAAAAYDRLQRGGTAAARGPDRRRTIPRPRGSHARGRWPRPGRPPGPGRGGSAERRLRRLDGR